MSARKRKPPRPTPPETRTAPPPAQAQPAQHPPSHPAQPGRSGGLPLAALCLVLLGVLWAYWPVLGAEFINFDDNAYVYDNPVVREGLSWSGAAWAFGRAHASNYHPLTWLSHMLDVQLFGLDPAGHHAVNLLLHLVNTLLVFLLLRRWTGPWRALAVAALFGLHPLHVESVAWVAERKDVLSGLFFLLTLGAYDRYVRAPGPGRYALVFVLLALGLLAKPMLVTLPCLLLLLDWWPLGRLHLQDPRGIRRCVLEKLPLFALVGASILTTLWAQGGAGALAGLDELPLAQRLANVPVAYAIYLWKTLWPAQVGLFHPFLPVPLWQSLSATGLLLLLSLALLRLRATCPGALTGWFWFLGLLVPVIGLVQVGGQAWAARYVYLPHLGLFWGLAELACLGLGQARMQHLRSVMAGALAMICLAAAWGTREQARLWENSETLYRHSLAVSAPNYLLHYNLGVHLSGKGRYAEAMAAYEEALRIQPRYYKAMNNLAWLLATAPEGLLPHGERDVRRGVALALQALETAQAMGALHPALLDTLGAALAAAGEYERAATTAGQAAQIAREAGLEELARELESRLPLYEQGRPFRLPNP